MKPDQATVNDATHEMINKFPALLEHRQLINDMLIEFFELGYDEGVADTLDGGRP